MKDLIRRILKESVGTINRDDITLNDVWYGFERFKHGYMQSKSDSPLMQIQKKLEKKNPKFASQIGFKPDTDFGDKNSKMIGSLFGKEISNPKSVEIGPVTLGKLGFKKPPTLPLNVKIVAITLSMEKYSDEPEEIKAIANIIANRSSAGRGSIIDIVLEKSQFSGWNKYQPVKKDEKNINEIMKDGRYMNRPSWDTAVKYAKLLLSGASFDDNTKGATHYYNPSKVKPNWGQGSSGWVNHPPKGMSHVFGRDTKSNWAKNFKGR
jgi:hypothetical protein